MIAAQADPAHLPILQAPMQNALADGEKALGVLALLGLWDTYLDVSGSANPRTRRAYKRAIVNAMADTLTDLRLWSEDDVVAYLTTFDPKGQMRGQVLRALKSFYGWAEPRGHVPLDPTARLRVKRPKLMPAPSLSRDDLETFLTAAEQSDPRARPCMEFMYATGARIGSMVALRPADLHLGEDPHVTFAVAKGDKPYRVPLGPRAISAASRLLELADYSPKMANGRRETLVGVGENTIRNWFTEASDRSGIAARPHLMRHTFATRLAENGTDVRTWIELMNHSDASQFRRYAAASDSNLREAVTVL